MNACKLMLTVILGLLFLIGCKGGGSGVIVEVYYRDFDKLWPINYTEEDIIKSPAIRRTYTKSQDIDELKKLLKGKECEAGFDGDIGSIDVYLLVKEFSEKREGHKWIGSKFDMVALPEGEACKITMEQRVAIDSFLHSSH